MLSHKEANAAWEAALRKHASTPLQGETGAYMPIGAKSMALLDQLWKARSREDLPDIGEMLSQGKDVRFFGDPHFEHANIIHMCERPFENVGSMDEALWRAIDSAAAACDLLVCAGDWAMKTPISWARKAAAAHPGKLLTVVGNHDAKGAKPDQWAGAGAYASLAFSIDSSLAKSWVGVNEPDMVDLLDWKAIPRRIMVGVSHWPVPPDRMPGPGWINIHGHIHNRPCRPLRVNCSVESIGFEPRSATRLIDARVLDDLARRQSGLDGLIDASGRDAGDSSYL